MSFLTQEKTRFVRLAYVGLAFLVAVLYDQLFWNKTHGLGAFLFVVIYLIGFITLVYCTKHIKNRLAFLMVVPILILAFDQMLYTNVLVQYLLPFVLFVLLVVFSFLLTLRNENKFLFYFRNIPLVKNVGVIIKNILVVFRDLFSWTKSTKHSEKYKQIAVGLIISVPILLLFVLLFAGADQVFGNGIERLFSIKIDVDPLLTWRFVRTAIFTFIGGAFFYALINDGHALTEGKNTAKKISPVSAAVVLLLVNVLFAIFVFIQIKYLFGSHDFVISQNITFAHYARNGFFQLVWVMVFSALLILAFYRSAWHHGQNILVSVLKLVLIAQIFVIAVSALKRMNLYQTEYGFTTLRLYVEWFIYFVCAMYILLAAAIIKNYSFKKFFHGVLICGVVAFTIVASANVDGIIAKKNIDRYLVRGNNLDLFYLVHELSFDAIPEIVVLNDKPIDFKKIGIFGGGWYDSAVRIKNWYNEALQNKKTEILNQYNAWYSFNLGAQRALNSLNSVK